jgi:hypothetical protein
MRDGYTAMRDVGRFAQTTAPSLENSPMRCKPNYFDDFVDNWKSNIRRWMYLVLIHEPG